MRLSLHTTDGLKAVPHNGCATVCVIMSCAQVVEGNPCIEYIRHIVFPWFKSIEIKRPEQFGGDKAYTDIQELLDDYTKGELHPGGCMWSAVVVVVLSAVVSSLLML